MTKLTLLFMSFAILALVIGPPVTNNMQRGDIHNLDPRKSHLRMPKPAQAVKQQLQLRTSTTVNTEKQQSDLRISKPAHPVQQHQLMRTSTSVQPEQQPQHLQTPTPIPPVEQDEQQLQTSTPFPPLVQDLSPGATGTMVPEEPQHHSLRKSKPVHEVRQHYFLRKSKPDHAVKDQVVIPTPITPIFLKAYYVTVGAIIAWLCTLACYVCCPGKRLARVKCVSAPQRVHPEEIRMRRM